MNSSKKIDALTGFRFIAMFLIVVSHFEYLKQSSWGWIYDNCFHNATFGVDYFFILSGFGMMLSYHRKRLNSQLAEGSFVSFDFAKRHVSKLLPLYAFTMCLMVPVSIFESMSAGRSLFEVLGLTLAKAIPCIFLLQSSMGIISLSHAFNGVCWFLSSLFIIYLISPWLMEKIERYESTGRSIFILLLLDLLVVVLSARWLGLIEGHGPFNDLVYGSPYRRVLYVFAGMILAQLYLKSVHLDANPFIFLAIFWWLFRNALFPVFGYIAYAVDLILAGGTVLGLASSDNWITNFFGSKWLVMLGNSSMYIYLIHYPVRIYVDYLFKALSLFGDAWMILETGLIVVITGLIVASIMVFLNRGKKDLYSRMP